MTEQELSVYRKVSNQYVDFHRLPNGDLLITADRDCRQDLKKTKKLNMRERGFSFREQDERDTLGDAVQSMGWDFMDDTVTCWGGPVIGEWGPYRRMTERELDFLNGECIGRQRSMYWLRFECAYNDGVPIVQDQVLCFQYADYCCNSTLDDLLEDGYSIWHCGGDWSKDPGDQLLQDRQQLPLFGLDELPPYVPAPDDRFEYHGAVPIELQVEESNQGWVPVSIH